ncbi:hypothetical protein BSL78_18928 [Apostichopus japonicus]|uniref:Uncharacterized protein n=1 Tax=Stichopus japonicus TaxID=307972 RepID=A0A2G8K8C5_STIJA|nr:hypothetical protein BSL78_18928 [Apostichopus japonicus]
MVRPSGAKNFAEYAAESLIPYVSSKFRNTSRVDVVWDRDLNDLLKNTARAKRGKVVRRRVVAETAIPRNWHDFLLVDENNTELFSFLSHALMESFEQENEQLVIIDGELVLCQPPLEDSLSLASCNHEEAFTRIMLHVAHAASQDHDKILVRAMDTVVVILAISTVPVLSPETEIWLAFELERSTDTWPLIQCYRVLDQIDLLHCRCSMR